MYPWGTNKRDYPNCEFFQSIGMLPGFADRYNAIVDYWFRIFDG